MRYVLWLVVAGCSAFAQDASEILRQVAATYRGAADFELVALTQMTPKGETPGRVTEVRLAVQASARYRMEGDVPALTGGDPAAGPVLMVHDGMQVWFYFKSANQYGSFAAKELETGDGNLGDLRPGAIREFSLLRFWSAAKRGPDARILREEAISFEGTEQHCWVIRLKGSQEETWWVDKASFRVLREESSELKTVYSRVKLTGPLAEELFRFTPPAGATRMAIPKP